jgi:flavin reductase (DIM6/NTAB) family NADH-FMN oxidoreductase RutF
MNVKEMNFISVDPDHSTLREVHHLLLGGVAPRPIALVSTLSSDGINNLAPFSFFNAFGANPPYVAFSPSFSGRDGSAKDTYNNIKGIAECVIQVVTHDIIEQVNLSSTSYPPEIDEFIKCGFTAMDSDKVKPKRVKESPFHMECVVENVIALGGGNGSGNLVLCRIVKFHVSEHIFRDHVIQPDLIDLIGRNSANYYTRASANAIFELNRPKGIGIGIDQLPDYIKQSRILTANNLAQLGSIGNLKDKNKVTSFLESCKKIEISADNNLKLKDDDDYKNVFNKGFSLWSENPVKAREIIEIAAKKALELNEIDFALLALQSIEILAE